MRAAARARALSSIFADDELATRRVLLEVLEEPVVEQPLDEAAHLARAELRLGLPLELGLRELDGDHRGEALAHVVAA